MYVHSMKELHNKICYDKYYHYFNHGIIIKTDTTTTLIKFVSHKRNSPSIIKTMESQWCHISGTEQQTKLTIKTNRLVQSKTYVNYRV